MTRASKLKKTKKRVHKQLLAIEKVFVMLSGPNKEWVSPQLALDEFIDIYDRPSDSDLDDTMLLITGVDYGDRLIRYTLGSGAERDISFARFWNIISDLNRKYV